MERPETNSLSVNMKSPGENIENKVFNIPPQTFHRDSSEKRNTNGKWRFQRKSRKKEVTRSIEKSDNERSRTTELYET
jgi:hypothetical protein